jgi:nucleoside-diphosphate-sugar epimerase
MKKILVTGGGGYVGNVLCRDLLSRGYKVKCVDNFHKRGTDSLLALISNVHFEFMRGDVTDESSVRGMTEGVDGIIHLAAIVGFPDCKAQPVLAKAVNVSGTENLLKFRDKDTPFVFASTGSIYGKVMGTCTEESPSNAVSLYGMTKRVAEEMVRAEPNTVSFRFATGFGVSPSLRVCLLVNDFVYQAVTQNCLTIFQADFRRTFIHVKDMSRAFIFGLENMGDFKHNVYNVGSNDLNWTKRELAEYISEQTNCIVSYAEIGQDLDQRDYEVDYGRINNEGFECVYNMQDGIDELIKAVALVNIRHQYE